MQQYADGAGIVAGQRHEASTEAEQEQVSNEWITEDEVPLSNLILRQGESSWSSEDEVPLAHLVERPEVNAHSSEDNLLVTKVRE